LSSWLLNIGFLLLTGLPILIQCTQHTKTQVFMLISLVLCLRAFYKGSLKTNNLFLLFALLSLVFTWRYGLINEHMPYLLILLAVGYYLGISRKTAEKSLKWIMWGVFGVACYGILQGLGFESLFIENFNNPNALPTPSWRMGSTIGNPTYLGAFVACMIPIAIRERNWWCTGVYVLCVFMTKSDMAIGAMLASLLCIPFMVNRKMFIYGCILALLLGANIYVHKDKVLPYVNDSGRVGHWERIVKASFKGRKVINTKTGYKTRKKYNLFGYGAGSFKNLYPKKMTNENFKRAHNEYLQMYWEFGIVFLVLFLCSISYCLVYGYDIYTKSAIICLCLNAFGLFVWQLAPIQFLSIYILCLNKNE